MTTAAAWKGLRVLAVVPARGGSKGLPGKNVRPLAGRPLIAYTLAAARAARTLDRIVVSTDVEEIARVGREWGGEVPFMRPAALAEDATPTWPVLRHAVEEMDRRGYRCDVVVTLQPTSPLRLAEDIDAAVRMFVDDDCDSVVSVVESKAHPSRMRTIRDGWVHTFVSDQFELKQRQQFERLYLENGAIYATRLDVLLNKGCILGPATRAVIMPQERSVDIDDELDLRLAEMLIREGHGPIAFETGSRHGSC